MKRLVLLFLCLFLVGCSTQSNQFTLTDEEQAWLDQHPVIYYAPDLEFAPYEFIDDNGNMKGLVKDYLDKLEDILDIEFEIINTESWTEAMELARNNDVNMLFMTQTEERLKHFVFSDPFIFAPNVYIVNQNNPNEISDDKFDDYTFGLLKNYASSYFFKVIHPGSKYNEYPTISDGLLDLASGRIDVFVADLAQTSYYINKLNLNQLIIYDSLEFDYKFTFAVNKEYTALTPIINKAIDSITEAEHEAIKEQWFRSEYKTWLNRGQTQIIYYSALVVALLALFMFFVVILLRRIVKSKTQELEIINEELENRVAERTSELSYVNEELQASIQELLETQEKLVTSEKYAALGKIISSVAHEINTPLGSSITTISYGQKQLRAFESDYKDNNLTHQTVETSIRRLRKSLSFSSEQLDVIANILEKFKRLEATLISNAISNVKLQDCVLKSVKQMEVRKILPEGFKVDVNIDPEIYIEADQIWIDEIVINLIMNAVVHGGLEQDTINIHSTMDKDIILSFTDHGKGISDTEKIFEPFYRESSSNQNIGLGLSIIYNIVTNNLLGTIEIDSQPYKKTTVKIKIPNKN